MKSPFDRYTHLRAVIYSRALYRYIKKFFPQKCLKININYIIISTSNFHPDWRARNFDWVTGPDSLKRARAIKTRVFVTTLTEKNPSIYSKRRIARNN